MAGFRRTAEVTYTLDDASGDEGGLFTVILSRCAWPHIYD